jgi:L-seryl-tRNA(Ser) seleniumtransferase
VERGEWPHDPADPRPYLVDAGERLARDEVPSLRPVLNATGVVLHTNLGRAPMAPEACAAMKAVAGGYSNLEFDLDTGVRGSRYIHCADLLRELSGAEDAVVVNNCAAALVLALNTLAAGRGVVVSRGELVEIGGGFRIPEMLERAGTRMVEVGSTNRTGVEDYERAIASDPAIGAILKVHRSNFRVTGFTSEASIEELAGLSARLGVPLIHDVGSGLMIDPALLGLPPEPRASTSMRAGVDIAVFSGDKLLGGPQAGILVGRGSLIESVRRNPLCRALRVDKGTLAALEATLRLYRDPESVCERIPVLRMLTTGIDELERRACRIVDEINARLGAVVAEVAPDEGRVGGGTFPEHGLPTHVVRVAGPPGGATRFAAALRAGSPRLVVRVDRDAVLADPRTLDPEDDRWVTDAFVEAWQGAT